MSRTPTGVWKPGWLALMGAAILAMPAMAQSGLRSDDLYRLRSVEDVQLSPDGKNLVYTVQHNDLPGRPYGVVWVMNLATGKAEPLGTPKEASSGARWSPDGRWIAYFGRAEERTGLAVVRADGSGGRHLAAVQSTNHPLPSTGERIAWSPDSKRIAYVSATPGPETTDAAADPMVITRYLYKPTASEGLTRFNDNRRLHIFVVDLETTKTRQLTDGTYYEHSLDWSPNGEEILFVSNRGQDPERVFNYDLFALRVADGTIRPILRTESVEYRPRWSPDGRMIAYQGTKRGLTSSETTMEDTHVWLVQSDGKDRRELGAAIDNRQGAPEWSPDGRNVLFTVQERGHNRLLRQPVEGGKPEVVVGAAGSVGAWSVAPGDVVAYTFHTSQDLPQLYLRAASSEKRLTELNAGVLASRQIAEVETINFLSFDNTPVEAFLTRPLRLDVETRHPMIAMIKGGPHGQQGPAFNLKAQVYAASGFATLMVNYRGSTGYGQRFTDAIFRDQNGGEAKDVLFGVEAAVGRYPWIDPDRLGVEGGSYGGQLTNWIITQTSRFKAAIPALSISNLVSFHYTAYYHDYLAVEFGSFPHQDNLIEELWKRSPLRLASQVKTPAMFIHGENDNDVPISEAEQFYIALKEVGVETVMVRYPREGHGIREPRHVVDVTERSIAWYQKHFRAPVRAGSNGRD